MDINSFVRDVKTIKIQGATAIAKVTIEELEHVLSARPAPKNKNDWQGLDLIVTKFANLRPTEPLARNLSHLFINDLKGIWKKRSGKINWHQAVYESGDDILYQLKETAARVTDFGKKLVYSNQVIFTHCHSSLAEQILVKAKKSKKNFEVYHTETRPLYQGHITSRNLKKAGVKSTLVVDSAASWLVSNHSGDDVKIDWVLLGADSLSKDGSVINKIGSFGIALAAYESHIPVYIVCPLLKMDVKKKSVIELRPVNELWPHAPSGTSIINYAFDCVPSKFITGLITEFGIIKPQQAHKLVRSKYPLLFK